MLIQRLREACAQGRNRWLGLWGMRGLGKTTLTREVCAALQHEFPGRTCHLELPNLEEPIASFSHSSFGQEALRQLGAPDSVRIQQASLDQLLLNLPCACRMHVLMH